MEHDLHPLTVAAALDLEVFRAADAVVACAEESLLRPVRWAHLGEVFDIAPFLSGGELLLLSSHFLSTVERHREYVDAVAGVGVAAIVVELGEALPRVPAPFLEQARRQLVPVILLRRPTRFIDITQQVHSEILDRQHGLLAKADAAARELNTLVLEGAELHGVVGRVSEIVGSPAIVEDAAHQVVEYATHGRDIGWLLDEWGKHSRSRHDDPGSVGGTPLDGECIWFPIVVRGAVWGRLHVFEVGATPHGATRIVVDRAAAAVGLTLLAERDSANLRQVARNELLSRLRGNEVGSGTLSEASALGVDLDEHRLVAIVASVVPTSESAEPGDRPSLQQLLSELRSALVGAGHPSLLGLDGHRVVGIVGVAPGVEPAPTAVERAVRSLETAPYRSRGQSISVGVSAESGVQELGQALDSANQAMCSSGRNGGLEVVHAADAGLRRMLIKMDDVALLAAFVERELGPLLDADSRPRSQLVDTLRTYMEHGCNASATARVLHVQRPSLYKRLARIERLLERRLDNPHQRLSMHVALEALQVLSDPRTNPAGHRAFVRPQ
jgi:PucR family transcriptional regulator, purine catabolism regulatory protein